MDVVATTYILHAFHSPLIRNCFSSGGWVEQLLASNDVPPHAAAAPQPRASGGRTGQVPASGGTSHTPCATAAGAAARRAMGRPHADARQSPAQPPAWVWPPHCEV